MIASCESCGEDFLTESDPHVVRPTRQGYKLYCYCHIKGFDEVNGKIEYLETKLAESEKQLTDSNKKIETMKNIVLEDESGDLDFVQYLFKKLEASDFEYQDEDYQYLMNKLHDKLIKLFNDAR
jgi:hypothetical protein